MIVEKEILILAEYIRGVGVQTIAADFNVSASSVSLTAKKYGVARRINRKKVTKQQEYDICSMYSSSRSTVKDISEKHKLSVDTIYRVLRENKIETSRSLRVNAGLEALI